MIDMKKLQDILNEGYALSSNDNACVMLTFKNFQLVLLFQMPYVTVLAKTRHVRTKTEFNFIAAVYRHTQYLSIPTVSSVKC